MNCKDCEWLTQNVNFSNNQCGKCAKAIEYGIAFSGIANVHFLSQCACCELFNGFKVKLSVIACLRPELKRHLPSQAQAPTAMPMPAGLLPPTSGSGSAASGIPTPPTVPMPIATVEIKCPVCFCRAPIPVKISGRVTLACPDRHEFWTDKSLAELRRRIKQAER